MANNYKSDVDTMFGRTEMVSDFNRSAFLCINASIGKQEIYIVMRDDLVNPSALKTFDQQFEISFPLKNAVLKFHTKVIWIA